MKYINQNYILYDEMMYLITLTLKLAHSLATIYLLFLFLLRSMRHRFKENSMFERIPKTEQKLTALMEETF